MSDPSDSSNQQRGQGQNSMDASYYSASSCDLQLPTTESTKEELKAFVESLKLAVWNWCDYQSKSSNQFSDYVWADFVNDFNLENLDYLPKHYQKLLRDTLIN